MTNFGIKERLIVALDLPSAKEALDLVALLGEEVSFYKIGWQLFLTGELPQLLRALRDKQFTYAVYRRDGSELLLDNRNDPHQMRNLVGDAKHADRLDHFRRMLKRRMQELGDGFEKCTWYREHWTHDRNILRGAKGGSHDLDALGAILRKYFA